MTVEGVDRRRQRGARSRRIVLRRAVDIASLDGLNGLSFGRLADDLGISKPGIQTLFRTKERLQLSAIGLAAEVFSDTVVCPALQEPEGPDRLGALIENWLTYASRPVFAGGCFWSANLPLFDSNPGPIRDALSKQRNDWLALLARQLNRVYGEDQITGRDAHSVAFQIDAVLNSLNVVLQLGEAGSITTARRSLDELVRDWVTR